MKLPDIEILRSLKNLKASNIESYNTIQKWIEFSKLETALSMSDIRGEELTNITKGRLTELKEMSNYLSNTDEILKALERSQDKSTNMSHTFG